MFMIRSEDIALVVTDMLGKIVYKANVKQNKEHIDEYLIIPDSLVKGRYMMNLHDENGTYIFPVMIRH